MSHPLSKSLLYAKINFSWRTLFATTALVYLAFLFCLTTAILRTRHPQYYYNLTGYELDSDLCINVIHALNNTIMRDAVDERLHITLYFLWTVLSLKNIIVVCTFFSMDWKRAIKVFPEIIALILNYYFIHDYSYQTSVIMRCPAQWQITACGIFIGYLALLYYVQFVPVIGLYVIVLRVMLVRFALFLPVLMIFIVAFASSFHMLFQNFQDFENLFSNLIKIGNTLMLTLYEYYAFFRCIFI